MEILREINEQELDYFVKRLEERLPYAIKDLYHVLGAKRSKLLAKRLSVKSEKLNPTFYTHRNGIKENCTFFAITGERDHNVWLFTFQESLDELRECLEKTKLIRWHDRVLFVTVHRRHAKLILECINVDNQREVLDEEASYYWLEKEEALRFHIEIPTGTEIRELTPDHSSRCNSIWDFRYEGSEVLINSLIELNGGLGLFDKSTNELLSYALINDSLAIGMLNTVNHARGKGYAALVTKLISIKIAQDFNIHSTAYIDHSRTSSNKLFEKLGFKKIGDCDWVLINKHK